MLIQQH